MPTNDVADQAAGTRSPIALRDMLSRISVEIDGAASALERLQDVLGSTPTGSHDHVPSEQLQNLDLLNQTLRELGGILASLASMPTLGEEVDTAAVLDGCKLSDLASRLGGGTNPPSPRDLELF